MIQACGLLDIAIFGVQPLHQGCSRTIKAAATPCLGASAVKLLNCFHVGFSCKFGTELLFNQIEEMTLFGQIMGIFSKKIIMDIFHVRVSVCFTTPTLLSLYILALLLYSLFSNRTSSLLVRLLYSPFR